MDLGCLHGLFGFVFIRSRCFLLCTQDPFIVRQQIVFIHGKRLFKLLGQKPPHLLKMRLVIGEKFRMGRKLCASFAKHLYPFTIRRIKKKCH